VVDHPTAVGLEGQRKTITSDVDSGIGDGNAGETPPSSNFFEFSTPCCPGFREQHTAKNSYLTGGAVTREGHDLFAVAECSDPPGTLAQIPVFEARGTMGPRGGGFITLRTQLIHRSSFSEIIGRWSARFVPGAEAASVFHKIERDSSSLKTVNFSHIELPWAGREVVFPMNVVTSIPAQASSVSIRVEPVQARSTARVNALLDAASETIHDVGYELLTTAMVAERAGASIGTVYRYFPDRVAVLQALAARNLDRVTHALATRLEQDKPATVVAEIDTVVGTLVDSFRSEKGFRSLRVGDVLDIRPATSARSGNSDIARVISDDLRERLGLRLDSAGRLAVETAVDVMDALLGRAFLHSDKGDGTLIDEARRMARLALADI
jgi:AcrR family transcriptional regulator